jgi:hypothetical protein
MKPSFIFSILGLPVKYLGVLAIDFEFQLELETHTVNFRFFIKWEVCWC